MTLKAVFLDVGRTLITERSSRPAIYAEVARSHGIEVGEGRMEHLMQEAFASMPRVLDGAFRFSEAWFGAFNRRLFGAGLQADAALLPELESELSERFSDPREFRLYPDSRELLDALARSGLFVGALSNWSERLEELLDGLGIAEAFDGFCVSAMVGAEKPEPEIFAAALAMAGVSPAEAIHAGDHPVLDYAGARDAGLRPILVDHAGDHGDFDGERALSLAELRVRILAEVM